jgi:hypothetical protein
MAERNVATSPMSIVALVSPPNNAIAPPAKVVLEPPPLVLALST